MGDCNNENSLKIRGDIEIINYGETIAIEKQIYSGSFLGILFQAAINDIERKNRGTIMAGLVQYRLIIYNSSSLLVDTIVARGFSVGSLQSVDRRQMISEANQMAACQLVSELFIKWHQKYFPSLDKKYVGKASVFKFCQPPSYK